jgi:hypothetical protein
MRCGGFVCQNHNNSGENMASETIGAVTRIGGSFDRRRNAYLIRRSSNYRANDGR